ncbi:MAG: hypothetical protein Q9175_008167 [Cornicularia normoerica]
MTVVGYSKRLRAVIQNRLSQFAEEMRLKGQEQVIVDDDSNRNADPNQKEISRSVFIDGVHDLMKRIRGRELPGTFNPLIVGDLFHQHSKPWKGLVERYSKFIQEKVAEIIRPHQQGHPITYNHYFMETVQKAVKHTIRNGKLGSSTPFSRFGWRQVQPMSTYQLDLTLANFSMHYASRQKQTWIGMYALKQHIVWKHTTR